MRNWIALLFLIPLAGCGSVFDPAPYEPVREAQCDAFFSELPRLTPDKLQFRDSSEPVQLGITSPERTVRRLQVAANNLQSLSAAYSCARNDMMRQQLLFDIPMYGLAGFALANGIFIGTNDTTVGAMLGAAGIGGASLYFSPKKKVDAYNDAAGSLQCTAGVASELAADASMELKIAIETRDDLVDNINLANQYLITGNWRGPPLPGKAELTSIPLTEAEKTALLAARDKAVLAYGQLAPAIASMETADIHLQTFALNVIRRTTAKVVAAVQKIDDALAFLKERATLASAPKPSPKKEAAFDGREKPTKPPAELVSDLLEEAAAAVDITTRINGIWGTLTNCTLPTS